MILAIDVGNTHIVLGCLEDGHTHSLSRLTTDPVKTEYEYAVIIRDVLSFDKVACETLEGAVISSVVPAVTNTLRGAVRLLCGKEQLFRLLRTVSNRSEGKGFLVLLLFPVVNADKCVHFRRLLARHDEVLQMYHGGSSRILSDIRRRILPSNVDPAGVKLGF